MKTAITTALICSLFAVCIPADAQSALNSTANTGKQGGQSNGRSTQTNRDYRQVSSPGHHRTAAQGQTRYTSRQGAFSPNGPRLWGTPSVIAGPWGQSGAVTGAPFAGTPIAPGNFAARQMGLIVLPPTQLTSLVRDSGMNDAIYGDEGTNGLPPYNGFDESHRIEAGMMGTGAGLTTGHRSDAPEAWGYPQ